MPSAAPSHRRQRWSRAAVVSICAATVMSGQLAVAQMSEDEREVVSTVQRLFDALGSCDADGVRAVTMADGRIFRLMPGGEAPATLRSSTLAEFAGTLEKCPRRLFERMWEPRVLVHKGIASLWAPYDFWLNGTFSHCGVDVFDLVKTEAGWKISGGIYTVEREGCRPSPLGPPSFPAQEVR